MKKHTFLLVALTFLFSCSTDTPVIEEETEYIFEGLIFSTEKEWSIETSTRIQHTGYQNWSDTKIEYSYFILEGLLMESYHFITDESIIDEWISDSIYPVNLPVNIEDDEIFLSSNTTYFRFNEEVEYEKEQSERVAYIEPGWAFDEIATVTFRYIHVPFIATFKGKVTGRRVNITGEWQGVYIGDFSYEKHDFPLW